MATSGKLSLAILLVVFLFSACNDTTDLSKFRLTYKADVVFTEKNTQEVDAVVFSDTVRIDLAEDMEFHGSNISELNESYVAECALEIQSPATANFTFLKNAKIYLAADGQPTTLFAEISDVPEDVKRFLIPINPDKNVVDILRTEEFRFRILFNSRRTLVNDVNVRLTTDFMMHTR